MRSTCSALLVVVVGLLIASRSVSAGNGALPDLVVTSMSIELETGGSCAWTSTQLGVTVRFTNEGNAGAGMFVVEVNGHQQVVSGGLSSGATSSLWFPNYVYPGDNTATVDATGLVPESDETNNSLTSGIPIPTLPPTCTLTPTPTQPTNTPTPTESATAGSSTPTSTVAAVELPDVGGGGDGPPGAPGWLLLLLSGAGGLALLGGAFARIRRARSR